MRIDTQIIEIEWSQDGLADSWLKIGAEKKGTRMAKEPGSQAATSVVHSISIQFGNSEGYGP